MNTILETPAPNLLGRHSADQTGECQVSCGILPATPGINQHSPLGRQTPYPAKQNKTKQKLNNKQGTENKHTAEGEGCCNNTR
jgi:hypothetical protein